MALLDGLHNAIVAITVVKTELLDYVETASSPLGRQIIPRSPNVVRYHILVRVLHSLALVLDVQPHHHIGEVFGNELDVLVQHLFKLVPDLVLVLQLV